MGLLGVAAGREPGGAGDAESPVWALVVAAGAGGQEGGLCGPTVSAPSVGLAGLERSPSCSFSLFPLLPQPTPPNLTPTYPGLSRAAGGGGNLPLWRGEGLLPEPLVGLPGSLVMTVGRCPVRGFVARGLQ